MHHTNVVDERTVAGIWERQGFDPGALHRLGLRLIFRGMPSDAGGPDYQDAILCTSDGGLLHGDVEFHVRASDWYQHGHHREKRFSRVILHVVWVHDVEETVRCDGVRVPILSLQDVAHPPGLATRPAATLVPHGCVQRYAALGSDELRSRILAAGSRRLEDKAARLAAEMTCHHPDQVAYAALLEALGYASNREAFRRLADALPYAWLMTTPPELREACLCDAAGLGPPSPVRPPVRLSPDSWRLVRLRPANHPALRLAGLATLLERLGPRLAETLAAQVETTHNPRDLRPLLLVRRQGQTYIGPGRADELVASVVLPLAAAVNPHSPRPAQLFAACPSPPSNRWTRYMEKLLSEAGHPLRPKSAQEHQGLHFLYQQFCRTERRAGCPVCAPRPEHS
jgi:hypothetical protein